MNPEYDSDVEAWALLEGIEEELAVALRGRYLSLQHRAPDGTGWTEFQHIVLTDLVPKSIELIDGTEWRDEGLGATSRVVVQVEVLGYADLTAAPTDAERTGSWLVFARCVVQATAEVSVDELTELDALDVIGTVMVSSEVFAEDDEGCCEETSNF